MHRSALCRLWWILLRPLPRGLRRTPPTAASTAHRSCSGALECARTPRTRTARSATRDNCFLLQLFPAGAQLALTGAEVLQLFSAAAQLVLAGAQVLQLVLTGPACQLSSLAPGGCPIAGCPEPTLDAMPACQPTLSRWQAAPCVPQLTDHWLSSGLRCLLQDRPTAREKHEAASSLHHYHSVQPSFCRSIGVELIWTRVNQ